MVSWDMPTWIYRCALIGLSVAFTIGAVEGGLRLFGWMQKPPALGTESPTAEKLMRKERRTGWLPRENTRIERITPHGTSHTIRINTTGQRGKAVRPRRPEERRILFLGDSYTMAAQVSEEQTFVHGSERLLAERFPTVAINGGVNGYGTYQELAYYRSYGRPLEADLVVLVFFPGNDFRDNMVTTRQGRTLNPIYIQDPQRFIRHEEREVRDAEGNPLTDPLSGDVIPKPDASWVESLGRHLMLGRLMVSRLARLKGRLTGDLGLIDLEHRYYFYEIGMYQQRDDLLFTTARELTLECLRLLRQWVEWDGAELAVVLIPSPNQVVPERWRQTLDEIQVTQEALGPLDFDFPNRLIREFCAEQGIPHLDLTDAFARSDNPADLFLTDDEHFSPLGHELVAAELANWLPGHTRSLQDPANRAFWSIQYAMREGQWQEAGQQLQSALSENQWPMLYVALGDYFRLQGAMQRAADAYQQALARDRESLPAWEGFGHSLGAIGDASGALEAWTMALRLQPTWWPYYLQLSQQLRALGRSDAEAMEQVDRHFAADESLRQLWWDEHISRGALMLRWRRFASAEREFQWATRVLPGDPVAFYNLGRLYQQTGRPALAREQFQNVVAMAPDFPLARKRLAELE